ncbi:MAG: NAD-dependent epimerase/dehydratase family protein [Acidobacteriota bacterium]
MSNNGIALVTGGSGYFGAVLRDRLRASGQVVRIYDLVDANDRPADVDFIAGDIRDFEGIQRACRDVKVIYHCVAQVPLARDKALFHSVNVTGTENLLKAAAQMRVGKIVLLSSSAVFGIPSKNPVDDTVIPRPLEDYGRAKLAGEQLARRYAEEQRLDITIIRPRTILGLGRLGIFQILYDWISEGRNVYVFGRGDNVYQFVHAEDLADACIKAAARSGSTIYNIGAAHYGTMRASLEGLIKHAGTGSQVRSLPARPAVLMMELLSKLRLAPFAAYHWLMYGRDLYFDITRAQQELNWQPKWSNIEMLCQSYDWYLAHREQVQAASGASPHRSAVKQGILLVLKRLS